MGPTYLPSSGHFSRRFLITCLSATSIICLILLAVYDVESWTWISPAHTRFNSDSLASYSANVADINLGSSKPNSTTVSRIISTRQRLPVVNTTRFDALFDAYKTFHAQSLAPRPLPLDTRVLMVHTIMHVGMGNRLPAIITGLFLAMTLNRTLVVEYDGFAELFEPEIDVVLKKEVREAIKIAAEEWADREDDLDELRRNGTNGIDANATGEAVPSMELPLIGAPGIRTKPPQNKHQNLRTWLTADFVNGQPWSRVPFLWFRTMDYGTPLLESNPHFKPWFDKTFDVSSSNGLGTHHPFHAAAKRMLRLKPHLQKEVDTFVKEHFDGAGLVVGLQLRTKKFSWSFPKLQLYVDVAKMIARTRLRGMREVKEVNRTVVLTNATASSPNDSSTIATTKTSTITTKTGNVRFFVATDDLATTNKIISLLHPYEAFSTSPTSLSNADRNNNPGTDSAAVIDMRLLSLCDELVVTFGSSFGFVASAWGGVPPHVIMHGKHDGWDKPVFWGSGGVSEPCMFEGRTVGKLGGEAERLWKESPNWVYHSQCHW